MNVIVLCHLKESTDEETGGVSMKPGLKGAVADEIAAYFDVVGVIHSEEYKDVDGTEMVTKSRRSLQTAPDRKHEWLKDRSWKLPNRIVLNGKTDFKRIHATVFQDTPDEAPAPVTVEVPAEGIDVIDRPAEQPENPFTTDSNTTDATDEATDSKTEELETANP
jgi:hypothetical protein